MITGDSLVMARPRREILIHQRFVVQEVGAGLASKSRLLGTAGNLPCEAFRADVMAKQVHPRRHHQSHKSAG